jgi:hypothetical protein
MRGIPFKEAEGYSDQKTLLTGRANIYCNRTRRTERA